MSFCVAHFPIALAITGSTRTGMASAYFLPNGRPRDFLRTLSVCLGMLYVNMKTNRSQAAAKKPRKLTDLRISAEWRNWISADNWWFGGDAGIRTLDTALDRITV
jgi:hypothetical protein